MKNLTFTYFVFVLLIFPLATGCTASNGKMKDSSIELINQPQTLEEENVVCLAYNMETYQGEAKINE